MGFEDVVLDLFMKCFEGVRGKKVCVPTSSIVRRGGCTLIRKKAYIHVHLHLHRHMHVHVAVV